MKKPRICGIPEVVREKKMVVMFITVSRQLLCIAIENCIHFSGFP